MAVPLHDLTRKNARFRWGSEQDRAFQQLKRRLITAPILGMPKDEGTYYLDTDASDIGLGAVLSQDQDGQEVVLAYASRTLSKQERNYNVTRRELLGIVYGLKAYRQYLLGRQFVIRTDHSALQSLRRTPEPIGQQHVGKLSSSSLTSRSYIVLELNIGMPTRSLEDQYMMREVMRMIENSEHPLLLVREQSMTRQKCQNLMKS